MLSAKLFEFHANCMYGFWVLNLPWNFRWHIWKEWFNN
uniref:Uncharacterized protein n=1 Tax=Arundo donax TaxID=35708 RepID=A0A0A9AR34_ARUDO